MSAVVLVCSCHNMEKRAHESFSLLFEDRVFPQVVKGRDRIYKFAKQAGNDHLIAISKLSGKFAYYVELEDNKITEEWDLLKGNRIA